MNDLNTYVTETNHTGVNRESVWKYKLEVAMLQTLSLPLGAKILSAGVQREEIYLWVLVNRGHNIPCEPRVIQVLATGESVPYQINRCFIDTVHLKESALVFHVFELT